MSIFISRRLVPVLLSGAILAGSSSLALAGTLGANASRVVPATAVGVTLPGWDWLASLWSKAIAATGRHSEPEQLRANIGRLGSPIDKASSNRQPQPTPLCGLSADPSGGCSNSSPSFVPTGR
jgi:hypothetical protein